MLCPGPSAPTIYRSLVGRVVRRECTILIASPLIHSCIFTVTDQEQSQDRPLVLISGFIHDVEYFLDEHPGGPKMIQGYVGKDATMAFFGGVYDHSNAAHNVSSFPIDRYTILTLWLSYWPRSEWVYCMGVWSKSMKMRYRLARSCGSYDGRIADGEQRRNMCGAEHVSGCLVAARHP